MGALILAVALPRGTDQVESLAAELRCPDCQALSVAESRTAASLAIRREIAAQLGAGRTADEVRRHFVDRYGEWILLRPASPLAWLVPLATIAVGGAVLAWWLRRRGRDAPAPSPPVDEATRRRLDEEREALDA
jgi:cytochrome c-type biogenesis protein CcmH/NrfF